MTPAPQQHSRPPLHEPSTRRPASGLHLGTTSIRRGVGGTVLIIWFWYWMFSNIGTF